MRAVRGFHPNDAAWKVSGRYRPVTGARRAGIAPGKSLNVLKLIELLICEAHRPPSGRESRASLFVLVPVRLFTDSAPPSRSGLTPAIR